MGTLRTGEKALSEPLLILNTELHYEWHYTQTYRLIGKVV